MTATLHAQRAALEELWQQGLSGHELLRRHTDLADRFIREHFLASPAADPAGGKVALIALGGYGRRELYPFSDIDLLLLHDRKAGRRMQEISEVILYPLWDAGFEVGHSVRTIKEAIRFAGEDFFFQVSLLDARFLAGDRSLHDALLERYLKKVINHHREQFVRTMESFRTERREKYGSHAFLLEPHIKEGKGGMRDIQAMLWVAKVVFSLDGLAAMEEAGLLQQKERRQFQESWNMLARIRNRLHYISRRKNDRLNFEYQEEMAAAFGYTDQTGLLAVEQFMRHVYRHLQTIAVITELFFEHVHEILGLGDRSTGEQHLERSIVLRQGTVRIASAADLEKRPHLLMRLFLQAGRTGCPLHHRTRQMVENHLHLVDDGFRRSRRVNRIFQEILMQSRNPRGVLESMLETGMLSAFIPEFSRIESLAQHDLYHIYTVDRHQLQTVVELYALRESEEELFMLLSSPYLVFLAALLHDIGKGRGGNHSEIGADMAGEIGRRFGLDKHEQSCLEFLLRYHLYLPENALRRDLEDPEFIRQAARTVGDPDRLIMLYLLTIADSRATGPSAWSEWKASLLAELFFKIKSCLEVGCEQEVESTTNQEEQGVTWLRHCVESLLRQEDRVRLPVAELPDDYLMSFTPETVVRHLRVHRDQANRLQQQVLLFPEARQGYWSLLMMSRDRKGLLAKLCGVLALHNLSVLAAQIFTWPDQTVVDVLDIVPVTKSRFEEQDWQALEHDLNLAVNYRLDVGYQIHRKLHNRAGRSRRQVQQPNRKVLLDNDSSQRFTVIEVHGGDCFGALYQLTQTLSDFGLDIHRAKIATEIEQLIDIFYVSAGNGGKLIDPAKQEKVRRTLYTIIGGEEQLAGQRATEAVS